MASTLSTDTQSVRTTVSEASLAPLAGIGAIAVTATLTGVYGLWGLLVGLLVFGAALVSSGPAAFIIAQLGIVSLVAVPEPWLLVATQCAAFPLLGSAAYRWSSNPRRLGRLAVVYLLSLGSVWALQANLRWLWESALMVIILVAAATYAVHRYERVTAGLVTAQKNNRQ